MKTLPAICFSSSTAPSSVPGVNPADREGCGIRSGFMAVEWTGSGLQLLLRLDRGNGDPLHTQLERMLREAIQSGRLQAGEQLPSLGVRDRDADELHELQHAVLGDAGLRHGLAIEVHRAPEAAFDPHRAAHHAPDPVGPGTRH
jgi:hypothetical protein